MISSEQSDILKRVFRCIVFTLYVAHVSPENPLFKLFIPFYYLIGQFLLWDLQKLIPNDTQWNGTYSRLFLAVSLQTYTAAWIISLINVKLSTVSTVSDIAVFMSGEYHFETLKYAAPHIFFIFFSLKDLMSDLLFLMKHYFEDMSRLGMNVPEEQLLRRIAISNALRRE